MPFSYNPRLQHPLKPKPFCFVLMPFGDDFNDVYQIGIKESCYDGGAYCERVDEQIFHESIIQRVCNQIAKADFIIADMSERNPNVFYEVGYAHALGKPTILLTNNVDDIPFDLRHLPHIIYNNSLVNLRSELTRRVKWFVENPVDNYNESKFEIELYFASNHFADGPLLMLSQNEKDFKFRGNLTIHHTGNKKIDSNAYTFNVLTKYQSKINRFLSTYSQSKIGGFSSEIQDRVKLDEVFLPDESFQYTLRDLPTLLPNAYEPIEIDIDTRGNNVVSDKLEYVFRIITESGNRDFILEIMLP